MIKFEIVNERVRHHIDTGAYSPDDFTGIIPLMLSEGNPKSAQEQLNDGYAHGGGFRPFEGFVLNKDDSIKFPGDPPLKPVAVGQLRDEKIILYSHAWVAVIQPDRSFVICRMD